MSLHYDCDMSSGHAPRKLWSRSRSRRSVSPASASTTSCRSLMAFTSTSGCFSHTYGTPTGPCQIASACTCCHAPPSRQHGCRVTCPDWQRPPAALPSVGSPAVGTLSRVCAATHGPEGAHTTSWRRSTWQQHLRALCHKRRRPGNSGKTPPCSGVAKSENSITRAGRQVQHRASMHGCKPSPCT